MEENDIDIDDQYFFALQRLKEMQRPANVHFIPMGSLELAKQTAEAITKALAQ